MSDLFSVVEVLAMANEIVGQPGPVELNTGVYEHNDYSDGDSESKDVFVFGVKGQTITLKEVMDCFSQLDELVDELEEERTYGFDGLEKVAENRYEINWGS